MPFLLKGKRANPDYQKIYPLIKPVRRTWGLAHEGGQVQCSHIPKAQSEILREFNAYILLPVYCMSSNTYFQFLTAQSDLGKRLPEKGKSEHTHCFLASSYTKQTPVLSSMVGSHLSPAECDRRSHVSSTPLAPGHHPDHVGKQVILSTSRRL